MHCFRDLYRISYNGLKFWVEIGIVYLIWGLETILKFVASHREVDLILGRRAFGVSCFSCPNPFVFFVIRRIRKYNDIFPSTGCK